MSQLSIREALETRLNAIASPLPTAWENRTFTPVSNTPHQVVSHLPANTVSPCMGGPDELVREGGIMQVSLYYPVNTGLKAILQKAEEIRAWFPKGLAMTSGGVTVQVSQRASVAPTNVEGEWVVCPISIPYFSNLFV